ncbi:MAG: hypothetical protein H0U98_10370 [Alphaproteobacteria bacterium]|nr:hypothetical protein [Alphaproteobacteria bacterium]
MAIVLSLIIAVVGFGFAMAFIFGPKAPVRSDVENVTGKKLSPYTAGLLHRRFGGWERADPHAKAGIVPAPA